MSHMPKIIMVSVLLVLTVGAYGAAFKGWFLPKPLEKPVSLREGSAGSGRHMYFLGGRSHLGGSTLGGGK